MRVPPAVSTFAHGGATLVAETRGTGPRTFVLLHGVGMGRSVFADAVERLRPHGRVIALDLPGYGEAPEPSRTPTIERMADLVAAFLVARVPGEIILVGHSMGTQVAVEVVSRHPGTAARVVLVGPTIDPRVRRVLPLLSRFLADLVDENPRVLAAGAREYLRAGPNLRKKIRAMRAHRPEDAYPRVAVPALVIRGADDLVCPRDWCRAVVAALPDARLSEVPDRGHETLIRDAAPTVARILVFASA